MTNRGKKLPILSTVSLLLLTIFFLQNYAAGSNPGSPLFVDIEQVELKLDNLVFSSIDLIRKLPDGFIIVISESLSNNKYTIVKTDKNGNIVCIYDKRGNGPGELRHIGKIVVLEDSILVSEVTSPFIHKYSLNLEFLEDYRIKKGGFIFDVDNYIGLWAPHYEGDKIYTLALYDKKSLEFKRYAFEVDEVPAYTHFWGGICKADNGLFAGLYSKDYKIFIFDNELNFKKCLIDKTPPHIKKYTPAKLDPHTIDENSVKWIHTWSKMKDIFFVDGNFILKYVYNNKRYLDIISHEGSLLQGNIQEPKDCSNIFTDGKFIWKMKWKDIDDEVTKYFIVKTRLNL